MQGNARRTDILTWVLILAPFVLGSCSLLETPPPMSGCQTSTSESVVPVTFTEVQAPATASAGASFLVGVKFISFYENAIYQEKANPGTLAATIDSSSTQVILSGKANLTTATRIGACSLAPGVSQELASASIPISLPAGTFTIEVASGSPVTPFGGQTATTSAQIIVS